MVASALGIPFILDGVGLTYDTVQQAADPATKLSRVHLIATSLSQSAQRCANHTMCAFCARSDSAVFASASIEPKILANLSWIVSRSRVAEQRDRVTYERFR